MGLHDPFGHLKHKLLPKEGPKVKLAVWLPTTKSQKSTRFPCVQVTCDIPLESSWQRLQLCLKPHLNRRSTHKVMGPQSHGTPNFGIPGENAIWMWASWRSIKYTIRGKVVASPKSRLWWVLWIRVCPWFVLTPNVLQLCTNHLVFDFVHVYVSSWCLSLLLIPSQSSNIPLYPQSVVSQGACPTPCSSIVFSLDSHLSPLRSLGAH
jgi:hypothetical protein